MAASHTWYKFEKTYKYILIILFLLAILSVWNPFKQQVTDDALNAVDGTGTAAGVNNAINTVKKPEAPIQQSFGERILKFMNEDPKGFFMFVGVLATISFVLEVRLRFLRRIIRSLKNQF